MADTTTHRRCRICTRHAHITCDCCGQAHYCSEAHRESDWNQVHQYEQVILTQRQHMGLDARGDGATRSRQQRDVRTRVRPRARQPVKSGSLTKEDIERELGRVQKRGNRDTQQRQQQGEEEDVDEIQEEMEVIRNTMPESLQRMKDAAPDVALDLAETQTLILKASEQRYRLSGLETLAANAPTLLELDSGARALLDSVLEPVESVQARYEQDYTVNILDLMEDMNTQWEATGDARRVEITPQHQTAIAHYARMMRLGVAKHGLAHITRDPDHMGQARAYSMRMDEFNQRLTHSIFVEGLVDYAEVRRSLDEARFTELGRQQGVLMFAAALEMTAECVVRLMQGEADEELLLAGFKDAPEPGTEAGRGFMANMWRVWEDVKRAPLGFLHDKALAITGALRGYMASEYELMRDEGIVSDNFVTNSETSLRATCDQINSLVEDGERGNSDGLIQAIWNNVRNSAYWTGRMAKHGLAWMREKFGRVSALLLAAITSVALVSFVGHFVLYDSEDVLSNHIDLASAIQSVNSTAADMSAALTLEQAITKKLSNLTATLMTENTREMIDGQSAFIDKVWTEREIMQDTQFVGLMLSAYEVNIRRLLDALREAPRKAPDFTEFTMKQLTKLGAYPVLQTYNERLAMLESLQGELAAVKMGALTYDVAISIEKYHNVLKDVKEMTDLILENQGTLVGALTKIDADCATIGVKAAELYDKAQQSHVKGSFVKGVFAWWGLKQRPLEVDVNGEVDTSQFWYISDTFSALWSAALSITNVRFVSHWLQQCDTRTVEALDMFYERWAAVAGSSNLVEAVARGAWALGAFVLSPTHSPIITTHYVMHSMYTLASAALWPVNMARRALHLVDWATQKCTRRTQGTFRAWTLPDVLRGGQAAINMIKRGRSRGDEQDVPVEVLFEQAGIVGAGSADPLQAFMENSDERTAKVLVAQYKIRVAKERKSGRDWSVVDQVGEWQQAMRDPTVNKFNITPVRYGLALAMLRDAILGGVIGDLTQLPDVRGGGLRDKDAPQALPFNASRYTAGLLAGARTPSGYWTWAASAWERVGDSTVSRTLHDLYVWSGRFAFAQQAQQAFLCVSGLVGLVSQIVQKTEWGAVVLAGVATGLAVVHIPEVMAQRHAVSNAVWRGTALQELVPLSWCMIRTVMRNSGAFVLALQVTLGALVLWDSASFVVNLGNQSWQVSRDVWTSAMSLLSGGDRSLMYETVKKNTTTLRSEWRLLQKKALEWIGLASRSKAVTGHVIDQLIVKDSPVNTVFNLSAVLNANVTGTEMTNNTERLTKTVIVWLQETRNLNDRIKSKTL